LIAWFIVTIVILGILLSSDKELVQASMRGLGSMFYRYNIERAQEGEYNKDAGQVDQRSDDKQKDVAEANTKSSKVIEREKLASLQSSIVHGSSSNTSTATTRAICPLDDAHLRNLLNMLSISITEITTSYQNTAFALIKNIIDANIQLPEIYDLVSKLTEQVVSRFMFCMFLFRPIVTVHVMVMSILTHSLLPALSIYTYSSLSISFSPSPPVNRFSPRRRTSERLQEPWWSHS
jgi:hypothetical protein